MNALLRRFVGLLDASLKPAGFVRRGPVFRCFDAGGNGIALDIQRTAGMEGEVAFFINVGVLLAPHLDYFVGDGDPRRDAMPHHGVWNHRLTATDDTADLPDHTFELSTEADADRAAGIVRTWLAANLPRMRTWLGDTDAMLAAAEADRERAAQARAEQLASGRWKPGAWPDGHWSARLIRAYGHAERGDVDAVIACPHADPGSVGAHIVALARRRAAERKD
ncbi:DUF4304 domain-containing protein [Actinoplanes sp. DH11]|uniref:DUF4304 domain-containing protein n=1 Tax=Actinoplanes sp. DH11 TaxID=2857011 RepID=UPI001E2AADA5|nr:DUF4304 domain-containing protein [Actinoplanes sp. DH11]